jgi:hypothetical protein
MLDSLALPRPEFEMNNMERERIIGMMKAMAESSG